jgi:hypothetical protein
MPSQNRSLPARARAPKSSSVFFWGQEFSSPNFDMISTYIQYNIFFRKKYLSIYIFIYIFQLCGFESLVIFPNTINIFWGSNLHLKKAEIVIFFKLKKKNLIQTIFHGKKGSKFTRFRKIYKSKPTEILFFLMSQYIVKK